MNPSKLSNLSDLIHRVTLSCSGRHFPTDIYSEEESESHSDSDHDYEQTNTNTSTHYNTRQLEDALENQGNVHNSAVYNEMVALMNDVFETVSCMKKAYVGLQQAHCPWDVEKMREYDMAVVAELKKLGVLRERFRRRVVVGGGIGERRVAGVGLREAVAPYEATIERLKAEVKSKEAEIGSLKEKLDAATVVGGGGSGGRKSRYRSHELKKKVNYGSQLQVSPSPTPELFESCMHSVKEASKSFSSLLLSLMKSSHWDIPATVRSIEASTTTTITVTSPAITDSIVGPNHAKYALESYVNRKIFQGFDHETFYMDGSLSSLLNPTQSRSHSFTQYRDMKSLDPIELLGIHPTCQFGNFCLSKYLSIIHPKMEESLFGDLEQRKQVLAGNHPRTRFYGEFLGLAKAVWMLHLLAFAWDQIPSRFEGSRGAEFQPEYMESVVRFPGGRVGAGHVVGFPVSPGFKVGNGKIVKARVYVVSRSELEGRRV